MIEFKSIQVECDAVTSKMMINHYFVDRFFRVCTFSWAEFDERSEEGSRNIVQARKYHTTIGSHTDMKITPLFSLNFMILAKETCEKFHFFLVTWAFSIFSCVSFEINFPEWLWCTKLNSYSIFKKTTKNYSYIGIGIGIGRYENFYIGILSVSADKEKGIIGPVSISADMKKSLSVYCCFIYIYENSKLSFPFIISC